MLSLDKKFKEEKDLKILSLINESLENETQIKPKSKNTSKQKNIHKNSIKCLINCTLFKLNVTLIQGKTIIGYLFNNNYLSYFFPKISTSHLLDLLKKKEENENLNINNKYNLKTLSESLNKNSYLKTLSHEINFPIENYKHEKNQISIWDNPSLFLLNKENNTSSILIEINLDSNKETNKYFKEINNKFTDREISCYLNGIVHQKDLLKNDISFTIEKKGLIKSIQNRIEEYKESFFEFIKNKKESEFKFRNCFFTPLLNMKNIGILFSTNNRKELTNLINLQTNYNSIISKKFILLKLFIGINIPNYLGTSPLFSEETNSTSNQTNSSKGIKTFSSENDNINNLNTFNSPLNKTISLRPHSLVKTEIYKEKNNLRNSCDNCFKIKNKSLRKGFSPYLRNNGRKNYFPRKFFFKNELNKLQFLNVKQSKFSLIDNNDKFAIELFNKYKNNLGYITNFTIFQKIISIYNENSKDIFLEISLGKFFHNFINLSSFGLSIPIIKENGKFSKIMYTPSLSSLILYIENNELYETTNKRINENNLRLSSLINNNNYEVNNIISKNDFYIQNLRISLYNNKWVKVEFNESKPPYLRKSLYDQIEEILNSTLNLYSIKLIEIDIRKSFFSIAWNPVNSYENQTTFLSYYLLNSSLIGILSIKINENKWLTKFTNNNDNMNIDTNNMEYEQSINNVEKFLFNEKINNEYFSNSLSFSTDYEFYVKNKF